MKKKQNPAFKFYFFVRFFAGYFLICYCLKLFVLRMDLLDIAFQNPFFEFYKVQNTGAAFSILNNNNIWLAIFALCVCALIVVYIVKNLKTLSKLELHAYAFLLSGIASNMLERFVDGHVTDYIKLNFINFPIFNLADVFINVGVALILISLFTGKKTKEAGNE